jgi:DNA primase
MVEDLGVLSETEAYSNAVRILRKAYLNMRYIEHSQRAAELAHQGDAAYVAELNQAQKIKGEMEELQFE